MRNLLHDISSLALRTYKRITKSSFFGKAVCFFFLFPRYRKQPAETSKTIPSHILIVRVDEIGDVVLSSALFRELRRNFPYVHITLTVKSAVFDLVETCPHIDTVLSYDFPEDLNTLARYKYVIDFARTNFAGRYFDLAILPRWEFDGKFDSFLTYCSRATQRVAYSEHVNPLKAEKNRTFDRYHTRVIDKRTSMHEVEYDLNILNEIGGTIRSDDLELWLQPEDIAFAHRLLRDSAIPDGALLVACCPGASHPRKIWPIERYVEICTWLAENYNATIVVLGGANDQQLGERIADENKGITINLVGKTRLRQSAAILKNCRLYVGNDTGMVHVAATFRLPIVEISCHAKTASRSHYFSPIRYGPWKTPNTILQPERTVDPCKEFCEVDAPHCIREVTTHTVKLAVAQYLQPSATEPLLQSS